MSDAGKERWKVQEARRIIDEIHRTLLSNVDKVAASLGYGRIVWRKSGSQLDVLFSTKMDAPER